MSSETIRVLLVQQNAFDPDRVLALLSQIEGGLVVESAPCIQDGLVKLSGSRAVDVVLLHVLPSAEECIRDLDLFAARSGRIPILVIGALPEEDLAVAAIRHGAQDYLVEQSLSAEQLRRAMILAMERQSIRDRLRYLSHTDELTGLYNRRGFLFLAEQQMRQIKRSHLHCLVLFLDLDGLKEINDNFGHAEGDAALVETAVLLRACMRESDIVARMGGDEFAAFMVSAPSSAATRIRADLMEKLSEFNAHNHHPFPLSFSIGIVGTDHRPGMTLEGLLAKADALMFREKRAKLIAPSQRKGSGGYQPGWPLPDPRSAELRNPAGPSPRRRSMNPPRPFPRAGN